MYHLPIYPIVQPSSILLLSFLHASSAIDFFNDKFPSRRQLNSQVSNIFNGENDNSDGVVVTSVFDAESSSAFTNIISRQNRRGRRSNDFSFSLNLPDLSTPNENVKNEDQNELLIHYSFDCTESNSNDQSNTSFFLCSNQHRQEREGRNLEENHDGSPKALFGINGPFIAGVIESASLRVQIISHIDRDDVGDMSNVTYRYAAAKPEDVFYEHVGLEAEREPAHQQIYLDDGFYDNGRNMKSKESSFQDRNIFMGTDRQQHDIIANSGVCFLIEEMKSQYFIISITALFNYNYTV